jgi:two-component system, chemotaxis family, chemotaxis protein CheY
MKDKKIVKSVKAAHLTVLVVDDDEMIRNIIVEQLKVIGFQRFVEAENGSVALKYILDPLYKVDLILCDWEMPKADGLTLLRAVRASRYHAQTPFILVTSQQSQERVKISQAKKHHVDAYIVKPFHAETLREKVFSVLLDALEKKKAS